MISTNNDALVDAAALQLKFDSTLKEVSSRSAAGLLRILVWDYSLRSEDLARLLRIPVAAVNMWRSVGDIPSAHQPALAHLVAFLAALEELPGDMSSVDWLNREPLQGYAVSAARIWTPERSQALLQLAAGEADGEDLLDREIPGWRIQFNAQSFAARGGDAIFGIH